MMLERTNDRYIALCKKYNISISISGAEHIDAPKYEIISNHDTYVIKINNTKTYPSTYETLLAYIVSNILLPNLILRTERLIIRRFRIEDATACFSFLSDKQGMYFEGCKSFSELDNEYMDRMRLFEQRDGQYVIVLQSTNEVIGTINVFNDDSRAVEAKEIGYAISPKHRQKGYAFEAISAILNFLQKELLLDMVVAGVLQENIPSIRLLEKLGFQKEGIRHKALWHEVLDKPVDLVYYYIDR